MYSDLPEYGIPYYSDNFTGPNWSDGRFQASVANPSKRPTSKLDWHSRDHDVSYANCDTLDCLTEADSYYYRRSRDMSIIPRIIGAIPLVFNAPGRYAHKKIFGNHITREAQMSPPFALRRVNPQKLENKVPEPKLSTFQLSLKRPVPITTKAVDDGMMVIPECPAEEATNVDSFQPEKAKAWNPYGDENPQVAASAMDGINQKFKNPFSRIDNARRSRHFRRKRNKNRSKIYIYA